MYYCGLYSTDPFLHSLPARGRLGGTVHGLAFRVEVPGPALRPFVSGFKVCVNGGVQL